MVYWRTSWTRPMSYRIRHGDGGAQRAARQSGKAPTGRLWKKVGFPDPPLSFPKEASFYAKCITVRTLTVTSSVEVLEDVQGNLIYSCSYAPEHAMPGRSRRGFQFPKGAELVQKYSWPLNRRRVNVPKIKAHPSADYVGASRGAQDNVQLPRVYRDGLTSPLFKPAMQKRNSWQHDSRRRDSKPAVQETRFTKTDCA